MIERRPGYARQLLRAGSVIALLLAAMSINRPVARAATQAPPQPVYAVPAGLGVGEAADPGVVSDGNQYYMFMTGGNGLEARAPAPQGPWVTIGSNALVRRGAWASGAGAIWAPDVWHTSAGWVLYYAAEAQGFGGQRCIGAAVSDQPAGPYEPLDTPLICPILGGEDPVADRPVPSAGVIDPDGFQASDGQRYLLYKTQQSPATIRMFPLSADGLHGRGQLSHELVRHPDSIEAPSMVQRGDEYVLFASANWYDQCQYTTVWRRSTDLWSFADKTEHVLLDQANTGLCGPGGADVVAGPSTGNPVGPSRIVLHGWVCENQPCQYSGLVTDPSRQREIYAAMLTWGSDGATPTVPAFLPPAT